ncbi:MAG: hypothetical protein OXH75_20260 [Acidobacteria bacterium]|nr:hypothetical protein [Acidobacteriota bacterium]
MNEPRTRWLTSRLGCALLVASAVVVGTVQESGAQEPRKMRESFATGQEVVPAYEGWEPNPDGSFNLVFGYFNRNWEEEIDIPPGPNNRLDPGGPDLGQPTRFLPRRNRFLFKVHVPADFGDDEVVWTLTSPNGETKRAYATLHPDYFIDNSVLMANNGGGASGDIYKNQPPDLLLVGETKRKVEAGKWVTLAAYASDDELPRPRAMRRFDPTKPPVNVTPNAATGLRLSWFVYRSGPGEVRFNPPQYKAWEDTRNNADSPFSPGWKTPEAPPMGKWVVQARFSEPGMYILRCLAHDGGLMAHKDVTFVVE